METPSTVMALCKMDCEEEIKGEKILMLDGIQDPGNLGTIIRSSVAFNFDTILISNDTVDPYNSKVIRASQGMNMKSNIIQGNLTEYLAKLDDYKIYGTSDVNGKNVMTYGSQGQQKNCILSVKLAMAELINEIKKEAPSRSFFFYSFTKMGS